MTWRLPSLPLPAKLLITGFLASMIVNHVFAGFLVWEVGHSAAGSVKEHFEYKNLVYLLRMSHQHAFGHGMMYAAVGAIFLLTSLTDRIKAALILLPFLGSFLDLTAWWLLKYAQADFEWLSAAAGTTYSLTFAFMTLRILYETWIKKETTTP